MAAARALRPALRAATMETLIGLLACTGLRGGETFALDRADIDRANGTASTCAATTARGRESQAAALTG